LRDRRDDIPVLAETFLNEFSKEYNKNIKYFDVEAMNYLMDYEWKGNVRELRNVIERAVLVANDDEILHKDYLPKELTGLEQADENNVKREKTLAEYEKMIIENTLKRYDGNKTKTADVLGIKRQTLYNKLKDYNLDS
jgi:DNA-binding NtrC family response regulator